MNCEICGNPARPHWCALDCEIHYFCDNCYDLHLHNLGLETSKSGIL